MSLNASSLVFSRAPILALVNVNGALIDRERTLRHKRILRDVKPVSFRSLHVLSWKSRLSLCLLLTAVIDQQSKDIEAVEQDLIHQQNPHCEEKYHQSGELKETESPSRIHKDEDGTEEILEVLESASPLLSSKKENRNGKTAILSGQVFPASKDASAMDEAHMLRTSMQATQGVDQDCPQNGVRSHGATQTVSADAHGDVEEPKSGAECYYLARERAPGGVEHGIKPEATSSEGEALVEEAVFKEDLPEKEKTAREVTPESLSAKSVIKGFDAPEKETSDEYGKSMQELTSPYLPQAVSDVASSHNGPAEDVEFFESPPRSATSSGDAKGDVHRLLPRMQLSRGHPVLETAAPGPPVQESHAIALKIISGSKILRSVVFITASTQTAVLTEARTYYGKYVQSGQRFKGVLADKWDLSLVSLRLDGFDMDMSTYGAEDLSFLVETIGKTEIPRFTLRVFEI